MRCSSTSRIVECPASYALPKDPSFALTPVDWDRLEVLGEAGLATSASLCTDVHSFKALRRKIPRPSPLLRAYLTYIAKELACEYGSLVHAWKETGNYDHAASTNHKDLLRQRVEASGMAREEWWYGGEHEVTYALNLRTLDLIRYVGDDRDAWKAEFGREWLTGTIDYAAPHNEEGVHWVDDLKTGTWPVSPVDNKQLQSYALYEWVRMGRPASWEALVSITQWPWSSAKAALPKRSAARATALDMSALLDDLRWALDHPTVTVVDEFGGEGYCKFCECRRGCPAWTTNKGEQQ